MKLFIGNLSWNATEEDLRELFESVGEVESIRIIVDPQTGRSKGFAFVQMKDREAAMEAIRQLNDKPFQNRPLRVSEAKEPGPRPPRTGGHPGAGGGDRGRPNRSFNRYGDR